ncbi:uncharacterized protein LOC111623502 [Centruroides sculpturatus]|uniref:uncharacterized protein LOC111623502 n=1 Tax=Centruroides sculpturatus TaxID=218467 RepID=UPI000C6CDCF1|nr:uncharacterized protein LOC111623502 [Centruroides sculpturatus]
MDRGFLDNQKRIQVQYMARLGQCFSHTEDTVEIPLEHRYVITEDDIEDGVNPITQKPYCFSNGIGKMSRQLAENIDPDLIYPGWKEYEESARISRQNYNHFLQVLMQRYGVYKRKLSQFLTHFADFAKDIPEDTMLSIPKSWSFGP